MKGGRTSAGQRAAGSHTAALAGSTAAVDALFRQAGVIGADSLEELADVAVLLSSQPLPRGRRVAVLTNAGGLGILCADACAGAGLELPQLAAETRERLAAVLPREASLANPVDMLGSAVGSTYEEVIPHVLADPGIDAVIVLFVPPVVAGAEEVAEAVVRAVRADPQADKPVLAAFISAGGVPASLVEAVRRRDASTSRSPPPARSATPPTAQSGSGGRSGSRPMLEGIDRPAAEALVARCSHPSNDAWLTAQQIRELFGAYGIPLVAERVAATAAEAVEAATRARVPGGRQVRGPGRAQDRVRRNRTRSRRRGGGARGRRADRRAGARPADGRGGAELLAGVVQDPVFGPLVAFGPGGVFAELIGEAQFRIAPLRLDDAEELVLTGKAGSSSPASAASPRPTRRRWSTWCFGSRASPTTSPRSPSSTSTRCSGCRAAASPSTHACGFRPPSGPRAPRPGSARCGIPAGDSACAPDVARLRARDCGRTGG